MKEIVLYSNGCPRCNVIKEKLDNANINYLEENSIEKMIEIGILTVPVLKLGDIIMDFHDIVKWIGDLNK